MKKRILSLLVMSAAIAGLSSCGNSSSSASSSSTPAPISSSSSSTPAPSPSVTSSSTPSSSSVSIPDSTPSSSSSSTPEPTPSSSSSSVTPEPTSSSSSSSVDPTPVDETVINFSDLEVEAITETKVVGKFTLTAEASHALSIEERNNAYEADSLVFTKALKTGGSSNNSKPYRTIDFTTTSQGSVTIWVSATNTDRGIYLYNETKAWNEAEYTFVDTECAKVTLDFHTAATYKIGATNGVYIYRVDYDLVPGEDTTWEPEAEPIPADLTEVSMDLLSAKEYKESINAGIYTINATAEADQSVSIDANNKKYGSKKFTQRLKLGGAGTLAYRSITLHAPSAGFWTIYCLSSSSGADRQANILDSTGTVVGDAITVVKSYSAEDGSNVQAALVSIPAAGDYTFVGLDGGINVYCVSFEA